MPLLITFLGILSLVLLVAVVKLDTFISFIIVSIGLGLASGMEIQKIGLSIQKGIGGTLGELVLIIGFGAMLGKLVSESGATQRITDKLVNIFGKKYLQWGLALAGFIIGIPLFYNAGFMIVIPLIFAISNSTKLPILSIGIPMLAALSVAHGYLPPHPSPSAIATQLHADLGKTLIYGICVAIPAIALAGPIFGSTLKRFNPVINQNIFSSKPRSKEQQPSLAISLLVALMPVFILIITSVLKNYFVDNQILNFFSEAYITMLVSLLVAIWLLGLREGKSMKTISKLLEEAFKSSSVILLIIGGAGALKQILSDSGTSTYIGMLLQDIAINPLILGWAMAGVLRICVGSATIAGLTSVGILAPMIQSHPEIKPELMVLAIGSGSLMFSHFNDGGFWMFKEFFNLTIKETLQTWTVMETIVSVVGLLGVLLLNVVV